MEKSGFVKRTKNKLKKDFLITHNLVAQNKNMSFEAKGLLLMLLSLPDDWIIHKSWIIKEYNIGREKLKRMFKELEDNGYFAPLEMVRENGMFIGRNYMVYDRPCNGVAEISPMYQNPSTVDPSTVNDTTKKDISIQSTYKEKENINKVEKFGNLPSGDEAIYNKLFN